MREIEKSLINTQIMRLRIRQVDDSGDQLDDNRAQLFSPNSVRLFLDIDLNIKDLKRWCQIKTPWSRIWTLILLGGRLHLLRRTESLYLGRWTLWGPVLDGRPDMVRHPYGMSVPPIGQVVIHMNNALIPFECNNY